MRSAGGGGSASARITLKNERSGSGGLGFFFRDNSHTGEQQEKMYLSSDGNLSVVGKVGIGTDAPGTKLSNLSTRIGNADGLTTNTSGIEWALSGQGYIASLSNTSTAGGSYNAGLLVELASTDATDRILDLESGGVNRVRVFGNGQVYMNGAVTIGGNGNGLDFDDATNQRISFNSNRALEGSSDGATLQVGEGYTKVLTQGHPVFKHPTTNHYNFIISKTFTATGSSVTRHVINLNTEIGASILGTLGYTVHVVGYGSGGSNGCNYKYTVGGYSGHDYSAQNHNSYGAGTIENGYDSAVNTEYDARGIQYHPCKNLGAYIANGEIYAYVPGPQQYGVAISNNSGASFSIMITISGTYTA